MALNGAAVSILHPPLPVVTPTPTHTAGQCLSRISWLRATPTRVQALHSSICEGAGRKFQRGVEHHGWRSGVSLWAAAERRPHLQWNCPGQRSQAARMGVRRASAGGRAQSVRSPLSRFHAPAL